MAKQLSLTIDDSSEESLKAGAKQITQHIRPEWKQDELKFKIYTSGITNKLLGVWCEDRDSQILIRVYGKMTELFIDRGAEKKNFEILHKANIGPELYGVFENGLCYGYIAGNPTDENVIIQEPVWKSVAKSMADFHRVEVEDKEHIMLFPKLQKFIDLIPEAFDDPNKQKRLEEYGYSKKWMSAEIDWLKTTLTALNCPVVFCHNDILLGNVIWNDNTKTAKFIDYEYGAPNYHPFDIANHFNEFAGVDVVDYKRFPSKTFQLKWLRLYLSQYEGKAEDEVSTDELEKWFIWVNKFTLASHIFWGTWAMVQAQHSKIDFDFLEYGIIRFKEYAKRKEEVLSLS